jgi:pimeloyl-ACP methyl ester carboxylesterase
MIDNNRSVVAPDGTRIAYSVSGRGPALVLTNGLTTTSFVWKYLQPRWREHHTVITWDLPGHGRSSPARTARSASIEGLPSIVGRIMDDAQVERAVQLGFSTGCQIALEVARQLPARVPALVALLGPYRNALSTTRLPMPGQLVHLGLRSPVARSFAAAVQQLVLVGRLPLGLAPLRLVGMIGWEIDPRDMFQLIADLRRVDRHSCARLACSAEAYSAADLLPDLRLPVLIMAGERDVFAPPRDVAVPMHRALPQSELVRIAGATHTALLDHHEQIARAVEPFLRRVLAEPPSAYR